MTKNNLRSLAFTKMTGAGNDFIIINNMDQSLPDLDRQEFARLVCHRHFGVGADGLFLIEKARDNKNHFKWDFYNADGSPAEMCGNGSRCVARFALDHQIAPKKMTFETIAGVVGAEVFKEGVKVQMTKPKQLFKKLEIQVSENDKVSVGYWDTGVPHVVVQTDNWDATYLSELGSFLRNHDMFKKTNGANATFFEIVGTSSIQAATFERGVEAVTLACGTGAVAAAAQAVVAGEKSPIEVQMPGGLLTVEFGPDFSSATLFGPAQYIYEGTLNSDLIKALT